MKSSSDVILLCKTVNRIRDIASVAKRAGSNKSINWRHAIDAVIVCIFHKFAIFLRCWSSGEPSLFFLPPRNAGANFPRSNGICFDSQTIPLGRRPRPSSTLPRPFTATTCATAEAAVRILGIKSANDIRRPLRQSWRKRRKYKKKQIRTDFWQPNPVWCYVFWHEGTFYLPHNRPIKRLPSNAVLLCATVPLLHSSSWICISQKGA